MLNTCVLYFPIQKWTSYFNASLSSSLYVWKRNTTEYNKQNTINKIWRNRMIPGNTGYNEYTGQRQYHTRLIRSTNVEYFQ